jgi:hypothetical protein
VVTRHPGEPGEMITPVTFMITVIRQWYSLTDHRDQGARYSGGVRKHDPAGPDPGTS